MEILNNLIFKDKIAIAFGFFDGVHLGHREVISSCVKYARTSALKSAVLTFKEHPCVSVWNVEPRYIISREERIKKIENLGVDYLYLLDFDSKISELSPELFINELNSKITPKAIFTGYNFLFGKNKSGSVETLKNLSKKYKYDYYEIPEQKIKNCIISSTNIRKMLSAGEIENANNLLGYPFCFSSVVIEGEKIGRTIGFPTLNLIYPKELIELKYGVYSAKIKISENYYDAILNYGTKPTVTDVSKLSAEVHVLDFKKDMYGETVTVFPQKYLREQKKFESLEELKTQISCDIKSLFR